jgi:tetratricopeptide (TPR) repeat protein
MKTKFLFVAILVLPIIGFGQGQLKKGAEVPEIKVTPPVFTGIDNFTNVLTEDHSAAINDYVAKNFQVPGYIARYGKEGTEVVRFVVTAGGVVTGFKVVNSLDPSIDQELIRILKNTAGMWKPGCNNDSPVDMDQEVSVLIAPFDNGSNDIKKNFKEKAIKYYEKGNEFFFGKNNAKKALRFYNYTINYLPYDASSLIVRGLCKYRLGDEEGALSDWDRVNAIGEYDMSDFAKELSSQKGYPEMARILQEKP